MAAVVITKTLSLTKTAYRRLSNGEVQVEHPIPEFTEDLKIFTQNHGPKWGFQHKCELQSQL